MSVVLALALVLGIQAPAAAPGETWDALAAEFERATVAFSRSRTDDHGSGAGAPWSSPEFRARFQALAASGEGRAIVWLLQHPLGSTDQQSAELVQLFERVRAAGEAAWVEAALHPLAQQAANLDRAALATWLEAQHRTPKSPSLRAAAMLASAALVADEDAGRAADLRFAAALLRFKGLELASGESPDPARIADLAGALVDGIEAANEEWFDTSFREEDDAYYSRADCPPDPRVVWQPAIEAVAARGGTRARVWLLLNTWPQDDAKRALIREQLEAVAREGVDEESLLSLSYRVDSWVKSMGLEFVEPIVRRLAENAGTAAQAQFMFGLADGLCATAKEDAERERGLALLSEVKQRWPDTEAGRRADGRIFRHTKLLVGMPIPDFEAKDVDGNAFKLSDYRGKVTVLDFWGFW